MAPRRGAFLLLGGFLLAVLLLGVGLGAVGITPLEVARLVGWRLGLAGRPEGVPISHEVILFELRLPRVILAAAVGAALAAAGAVFQALFRNPMADPAIIGVSSGAALGAVGVILLGWGAALGGLAVPAAALAGAMVVAVVVYRLARVGPTVQVATLLLAGIAMASIISAVISLAMAFSGEQVRSVYFWLLGGLGARGWHSLAAALPFMALGAAAAVWSAPSLNLISLGEERAAQLGLDVERFKRGALAAGAVLTGAAVAVAGVIGFVGLMTPHILRLLLGADHRRLVPAALLGGAALMVLADLAARLAVAPEEIPVGAVTALLGGPFFLWLLRRERRPRG